MMHFRRETNLQDAPREIVFCLSPFAPIILEFGADLRHRRFWRENKIAPSPIIVGLRRFYICIPSVTFAALKGFFST